jgi:hypothetical protein
MLWERNVGVSIGRGFADGFLFPYREVLALANDGKITDAKKLGHPTRTRPRATPAVPALEDLLRMGVRPFRCALGLR